MTAHLHGLGLSAFGVDLSPAMVALARRAYPGLRFNEGLITAVETADGALGDEPLHLAEAFGQAVSLDFYRFQPDRVAQLLDAAGLAVFARLLREPDENEKVQQAYLLARKPGLPTPQQRGTGHRAE